MPTNNETIIETVDVTANEVANAASKDHGFIFMGLGFVAGIGLTVGAVKGRKLIKKAVDKKKAKKAAKKAEATAEKAE